MEKVKIGDICEILNGYAFKSEKYVSSGIRILRIANVQKGYIEDSTPVFYPEETLGLERYMLEEGDLLISLTGNVGRVATLMQEFLPAALNQRVACLRVKRKDVFKPYLFHFLNSGLFESHCVQSSKGVAQKNMSTEWLKEYEIPLYPIEEQKEIAKTLNKIGYIINGRKEQLYNLDNLIKSRFVEMFGKEIDNTAEELRSLCAKITDGTHQSPQFVQEGIPFIFISNIQNNKINYDTEKYISQKTYDELTRSTAIELGDVLLTIVGSYGNPAVVDNDKKFCFQRHIAQLKPKHDLVNSYYLHTALRIPYVREQIDRRVKGIAQKTLNLSELCKVKINVPELSRQNEFVTFIQRTDKLKVEVQKSLDETEMLFDSLMQQYFE